MISKIEVSQVQDCVVLKVVGKFDFELIGQFQDAWEHFPSTKYIIDLSSADYLDSSAMGMMLHMRRLLDQKTIIKIIGAAPAIKNMLMLSRFDKKFEIE